MSDDHLDSDRIFDLLEDLLDDSERAHVLAHVQGCARCAQAVEADRAALGELRGVLHERLDPEVTAAQGTKNLALMHGKSRPALGRLILAAASILLVGAILMVAIQSWKEPASTKTARVEARGPESEATPRAEPDASGPTPVESGVPQATASQDPERPPLDEEQLAIDGHDPQQLRDAIDATNAPAKQGGDSHRRNHSSRKEQSTTRKQERTFEVKAVESGKNGLDCPVNTRPIVAQHPYGEYGFAACERSDGELHGPYRSWFGDTFSASDNTRAEGEYSDGERSGQWVWFDESGWKSKGGRYIAGRKEGVWLTWDDKGQTLQELVYQGGDLREELDTAELKLLETPPGDWKIASELVTEYGLSCEAGARLKTRSSDSGHEAWCEDKDGLTHGFALQWSKQGDLLVESVLRHGKKHGPHREYRRNGRLARVAYFEDDVLDGVETIFMESGTKESETEYHRGVRDGLHLRWHESGALGIEEHYVAGKRDGPETHWYESGQPSFVCDWKAGKKDGVVKTFKPDGSVEMNCRYEAGRELGCSSE